VFVEKLELFGFKSFATRTEVPFARGITAIVGPNGCGKSNISDALRWVLGEQSARVLRGERIQDVIFKGSGTAKPLGMAEVVLTVSNDDGSLPLEYTQVAVARRIFRSGESEFSINKVGCRLKDIRDLFSGTGLGSHGYAVIERDMIDQVLSDKDEARRFLFEEAAGIMRYKQRRKESERRLDGVEQDLTRIEDMIREIERGTRSLARQAGKVRRWRRLKEELDHHEVRAAWERWRQLRDRSASSEGAHRRRESERGDASARLTTLEARREAQRVRLMELGDALERTRRALDLATREVTSAREEIHVLGARAEAWAGEERDLRGRLDRDGQRREQLGADLAAIGPRLESLCTELEEAEGRAREAAGRRSETDLALRELRGRLQSAQQLNLDLNAHRSAGRRGLEGTREKRATAERRRLGLETHLEAFAVREEQVRVDLAQAESSLTALEQEREETTAQRTGMTEELDSLRHRRGELAGELSTCDRERAALGSRLSVLLEQKERHAGFDAAVRHLLDNRSEIDGFVGVVGEELRLRPGAEAVGAGVLGSRVQWILVRDEEAALAAMDRLRGRGLGGVTLFPLVEAGADPADGDAAVVELFEVGEGAVRFLGRLATTACLAGSMDEARRLASETGRAAVTPDGDLVEGNRVFRLAGRDTQETEILQRELEIPQLSTVVETAEAASVALRAEDACLAGSMKEQQDAARVAADRLSVLQDQRTRGAEARTKLRTELAMLGEERTRLAHEREGLEIEVAQLTEEIGRIEIEVARTEDDAGRAHGDFGELAHSAEEQEQLRDERTREASDREMEAVRLRGLREAEEGRRASLEREAGELARSLGEATQRLDERSRVGAEEASRAAELRAGLDGLDDAREARTRESDFAREANQECQDAIFALDADVRSARETLDGLVAALHTEEVERLQVHGEAERIRERVLEDHAVDLETYEPKPDPVTRHRRRGIPTGAGEASGASAGGGSGDEVDAAGYADPAGDADVGGLDEDALARLDDAAAGIDDEIDDGLGDDEEVDGGDGDEDAVGGDAASSVEAHAAGADEPWTPERRADRISELRRAMQLMGSLNFLAEEEYRTSRERLDFHRQQVNDLRTARADLLEAIGRINETAGKMFEETFAIVQANFLSTFDKLFPGGEASLSLSGDDPLEGDIEIAARPRGKKLESIRLLSSGERALTAIALLFAIYLAKPSPVCLLDEVDAPLDDANLDRFLSLVRHFSERTQFICITHNKKTMEMADRLFGVTMQEPGISKLVSVRLDGRGPGSETGARVDAVEEAEAGAEAGAEAAAEAPPVSEDSAPSSAEGPAPPGAA
jgi:chromosome segregation protein